MSERKACQEFKVSCGTIQGRPAGASTSREKERGFAPSHTRVREMAEKIIESGGRSVVIGKSWGTQSELMRQFFDQFDTVRARYGIQQKDIWNVDEHGIALGVCVNTHVIDKAGKKRTYMQSPESHEWVSIIKTISATGKHIRLVVIFKGQNVQTSWFEEDNLPN
ncbi:hypothetical protein C7212DRAFT_354839 [Tuber magnatum]|uniref:DDE-1 domain-containing protein n=1 Tax=Tuber magnatum TaxID=42249 RepID=A0A317SEA3_9PEZI|nr:hypothetical protein C7212DRAFT_354839 [Tuber magnatum]